MIDFDGITDIILSFFFNFQYNHAESARRYENIPKANEANLKNWSRWAGKDAKNNPKVDLYVIFGKDTEKYGAVGIAYVGGACKTQLVKKDENGKKVFVPQWMGTSFTEWRPTPSATAAVFPRYKNLKNL